LRLGCCTEPVGNRCSDAAHGAAEPPAARCPCAAAASAAATAAAAAAGGDEALPPRQRLHDVIYDVIALTADVIDLEAVIEASDWLCWRGRGECDREARAQREPLVRVVSTHSARARRHSQPALRRRRRAMGDRCYDCGKPVYFGLSRRLPAGSMSRVAHHACRVQRSAAHHLARTTTGSVSNAKNAARF
jgi:hypothetical protein